MHNKFLLLLPDDWRRALYVSIMVCPSTGKQAVLTWLGTIENDLWPLSLGPATAKWRAQNRIA